MILDTSSGSPSLFGGGGDSMSISLARLDSRCMDDREHAILVACDEGIQSIVWSTGQKLLCSAAWPWPQWVQQGAC